MNYLNSYLRSKLDLSHIGFIRREKESNYFCTPVLSKVIGWAGVDGIHFCITKGFNQSKVPACFIKTLGCTEMDAIHTSPSDDFGEHRSTEIITLFFSAYETNMRKIQFGSEIAIKVIQC